LPSIDLINQRTPTCLGCEGRFRVVLPTKSDQESLALVFARSRIEFIDALREATGCGLPEAKGVAGHVVSTLGHCHRCNHEIRDRLVVDCPRCRSLNIQFGRPAEDVTCPACGFAVLADGYGSYEICEVCGWEDDGVQLANPTSGGGANRRSLADTQAEIVGRLPVGVMTHGEFCRDPLWRPLNAKEVAEAETKRRFRHWHTTAVEDRMDVYWLRAPASPDHQAG
jgi:ribosomal protein S27E